MASPQLENGHTRISNELIEELSKLQLSGNQWRIIWVILRKTYGYNKKMDRISYTQFAEMTGIPRKNIPRELNTLIDKKVVLKTEDTYIRTYGINKDYSKWEVSSKLRTVLKTEDRVSSKLRTKVSSELSQGVLKTEDNKRQYTKDNKDNIQKTICGFGEKDLKTEVPLGIPFKEIIDHLNQLTGKNFKHTTKTTKQAIHARWLDGYRLDDFKHVHTVKSEEWKDDSKMSQYLCPDTLYRPSKFEKYLNQMPVKKQEDPFGPETIRKNREAYNNRPNEDFLS